MSRLACLRLCFAVLATGFTVVAAAAPPEATDAKPAPTVSRSYSLGLSFATQWREAGIGSNLEQEELLKGIRDGLGGKALTAEDRARASAFLKATFEDLGKRNAIEAQEFLAKNAKAPGVVTTASGLEYIELNAGDPASTSPQPADKVLVNYRGTLIDGTEFDSSYARNKPTALRADQVIPGWREALGLMHRGSKLRIFVPPALAYGASPPPAIPPNAVLIFEIELISVNPAPTG